MKKMEKRMLWIEILRCLACFNVIVNHTNSYIFLESNPQCIDWWCSLTYFFVCRTAVPTFLMISGYLLLRNVESWKKILWRIIKMCLILTIFSFIYYVAECYVSNVEFKLLEFVKHFYSENITNAYWYLYLYIGILFMLPILQRLAVNLDKSTCGYLIVVVVVLRSCLPIIAHYKNDWTLCKYFTDGILSIYVTYLLIGLYLVKFVDMSIKYAIVSVFGYFIGIVAQIILTYYEYMNSPGQYLFYGDNTLLPTVITSASLFYFVRFVGDKITNKRIVAVVRILGGMFVWNLLGFRLFYNILFSHL